MKRPNLSPQKSENQFEILTYHPEEKSKKEFVFSISLRYNSLQLPQLQKSHITVNPGNHEKATLSEK